MKQRWAYVVGNYVHPDIEDTSLGLVLEGQPRPVDKLISFKQLLLFTFGAAPAQQPRLLEPKVRFNCTIVGQ